MHHQGPLRKLPIDFEEVAMAMEDHGSFDEQYLDLETGELILLLEDLQHRDLEDEEVVARLPKWEQEMVPLAREIHGGSDRYERIPQVPTYEIYNLMVTFAESVTDPHLRELLAVALRGKGAFGRFKSVLYDRPAVEEHWYKMKQDAMDTMIRDWLAELGIEPVASVQPDNSPSTTSSGRST